jgi:biopolymer transport protein ExbB/TolQ
MTYDNDIPEPRGHLDPHLHSSFSETDQVSFKQAAAGAGFLGLIGFGGLFVVASLFFITENYFIAMFTISVGLLVYITGLDLARLLLSSVTIFFSSKHLLSKASHLQETLVALETLLNIERDKTGILLIGTVGAREPIVLPANPLTWDMQQMMQDGHESEHAQYLAHSYYVECHELYESSSSTFDFVSSSMPLFGLIGTIVGLIAMFDSLGADVTVESLAPQLALALKTTLYGAVFSSFYKIIGTRFERRMTILDYDYETFCRALQVIITNKNPIEVE